MSGQVLFHPSYLCQIGESDQGLIVWLSNSLRLPRGWSGVIMEIDYGRPESQRPSSSKDDGDL